MVLRFTVMNFHFLKGMVMITWSPTYFGVEGVLTVGYTPISLLNLAPQSFTSFESTDTQFNAIIDYEQLQAVFRAAQDSDPIEFSQSFECDRIHKHGVLNARFNRPVNTGDSMNDIISMTIIDMRSEVFIFEGRETEVMITTHGKRGVISTRRREDGNIIEPTIRIRFNLQGLDLEPGAALSNKVGVVRRGEEVALIWFGLDETRSRLHGQIIHCLH